MTTEDEAIQGLVYAIMDVGIVRVCQQLYERVPVVLVFVTSFKG